MKPYGLYHWLEELVGQTRALELARDETIPHPPSTIDSNAEASSSSLQDPNSSHRLYTISYAPERQNSEAMDIDNDEGDQPPAAKRMRVR